MVPTPAKNPGVRSSRHHAVGRCRQRPGLVIAICALAFLAGCKSVSLRERNVGLPPLAVDGLALEARLSATANETIAMLDLEKVCARPSLGCAARIIDAQGTVREATRLVAASDVLY